LIRPRPMYSGRWNLQELMLLAAATAMMLLALASG
jgi:hypothetical protein